MLSNFHTHTIFCDGENTPEEMVLSAIEKGFDALGFSGHGYTDFDLRYCVKDIEGYIAEIGRLKEKYKGKIEIYLGVEEDAFHPADREKYDYIIGSSHYFYKNGEYYAIDSSHEYFKKCLEIYDNDILAMATDYYTAFCKYINERKPDIIGHFDLLTKYDELDNMQFLSNPEYNAIAEKAVLEAVKAGSIFEVNTGAISRGLRTTPYPAKNLLQLLFKHNAKLILSADSHKKSTIDCCFSEATQMLKEIGFTHLYTLKGGKFVEYEI